MATRVEDATNSTYYYELQKIEDETNRTEEAVYLQKQEGLDTENREYRDENLGNNIDIET